MKKRHFYTISILSAFSAQAGTIALPTFGTQWDRGANPGQAQVTSEQIFEIDLDNRSGLTPGMPIQITVSSPDRFLWLGGFHLVAGPTTISSEAKLTLNLGGESQTVTANLFEDFGDLPPYNNGQGGVVSDPVGYIQGDVLPDLVFTVPWDSDLTQAQFTFEQESEITGEGQYFNQSSVSLTGGTVEGSSQLQVSLETVPEPGSASFLALAGFALLAKRRR